MMWILLSLMWLAAGDLPGEGTLPGKKQPPTRALPSEATLPKQLQPRVKQALPVAGPIVPSGIPAVPPAPRIPASPPKPEVAKTPAKSLPAESQTARTTVSAPPASRLPSESRLPAALVIAPPPPPLEELLVDLDADPGRARSTDSPSDQPARGDQPPGAPADGAQDRAIGAAPAGIPWLRLNMRGHVGLVRALTFTSDGGRLCSAGDDKAVEVWTRMGEPAAARWIHERAVRWQVERGPRGRIHALAAAPGLVALAGYGAMGAQGEIWLVDPASGDLKRALIDEQIGHRQLVVGLAFPPQRADILASQDVDGRVLVWRQDAQTGLWSAKQLLPPDTEREQPERLQLLQSWRRLAPLAMLDDRHVVVPVLVEWKTVASRPEPLPFWTLETIDIETGERTRLQTDKPHGGTVMAIAASPDGRTLASSDAFGSFSFWNVAAKSLLATVRLDAAISALAWSPDGKLLCTGSAQSPRREGKAVVQWWDTADVRRVRQLSEQVVEQDVYAVALHPAGKELAYTQGANIVVTGVPPEERTPQLLRGLTGPVLRVAFAAEPPLYRVAMGSRRHADGRVPLESSFDLAAVRLDAAHQFREQDWLDDARWKGDWSVETVRDETGESHWLYQAGRPAARLPLHPTLHGRPSAVCWIPDRAGRPWGVAIGTSLQGNVFVCRLEKGETAVVLRQYRGHEGAVRALSVSRDQRYLVSGSDDATVRVWKLDGFNTLDSLTNRWGARFEVRDGRLTVVDLREDGPLHHRGVREEDVVHALAWRDQGNNRTSDRADEMLQILQTASPDLQVVFDVRRRGAVVPGFQMLPAWRDLAALFVATNREWAYWTPAGYYDASFDGHKLFGWQVNRSVDALPEFFLAAQFRGALERPQVLNRLLDTGSLPAALRAADQVAPDADQDAVLPQYRLKPRVEILEPAADVLVANQRVTIRARVEVREGLTLIPPKAFANGVVAPRRRQVEQRPIAGGTEYVFEWDAGIPADPRVLIQVIASTDAEAVEQATVQVRQQIAGRTIRRLYVLAAGVNDYQDAQIQRLEFAAANAQTLAGLLQQQSAADATTLLNDAASRPMWRFVTTEYAERLRDEAAPDDLLVFFLSGHGVRDAATERYFFIAANARYDDVRSQRFGDCLSFEDFAAFADVPCRKLVVLDTCHAGAVQQPLRQQDLKAAVRALQDDVVLTMTASEGSQEAAEDRSRGLGRFTARLLDALQGAADAAATGGDADGVVTLREAGSYVQAAVAADSARDSQPQHPTFGPIDLLDYVDVPLTKR